MSFRAPTRNPNTGVFMLKKTSVFLTSLFILSAAITFTSCNNFMSGDDLYNQFEDAVNYANSPFVNVRFSYDAAAITKMSPNGLVDNKYKATDTISVECEEKDEYQFVKWTCVPEKSVNFEPENSNTTKAKIQNGSAEITISPVVYKRPIPVVTPSGAVAVEKNSAINIAFDHEMNNTDEDLEKIDVSIDGESIKNHFSEIKWSDDKKSIWFSPDENNLIDLQSGTKTVTITIPADAGFNYLADGDGEKIVLKNDFVSTYRINSETSDKLELKITHTEFGWGSCSLVGNISMNLNQTQAMLFNINKDYAFVEWQIKCNGELQTSEQYSKYLIIDNPKSPSVTITAKKHVTGYEILPYCVKRPSVLTHSPAYSIAGVLRDTRLKFFFNQKMSDSSIYWTEAELEDLLGENYASYKFVKAGELKNEKGEQYYYAYWDGKNSSSIVYKNIAIYERGTTNNYLQYYGMPYWENGDKSILVMLAGNTDFNLANPKEKLVPPEMKDIEFVVSSLFTSENGVTLTGEYTNCYRTNSVVDNEGPEFGTSFMIKTGGNELRQVISEDGKNKIFISEEEKPEYKKEYYHYLASKDATLTFEGTVNDAISKPSKLEIKLKNIEASGYGVKLTDPIILKRDLLSDDSGASNVSGIKFDLSKLDPDLMENVPEGMKELPEGMYEVEITAFDGNENPTVYGKTFRILYDNVPPEWNNLNLYIGGVGGHVACLYSPNKLYSSNLIIKFPDNSTTDGSDTKLYTIKEFNDMQFTHPNPYNEITFALYDYAGNKVEKTVQPKDIAKGMYCYECEIPKGNNKEYKLFWTENGEIEIIDPMQGENYNIFTIQPGRVLGPDETEGYEKVRIYKESNVNDEKLSFSNPYGDMYEQWFTTLGNELDEDCGKSISEYARNDSNNVIWSKFKGQGNWYLPTEKEFNIYTKQSEVTDLLQEITSFYLYAAKYDTINCLLKYVPDGNSLEEKWPIYGKLFNVPLQGVEAELYEGPIVLPMMQLIDCTE